MPTSTDSPYLDRMIKWHRATLWCFLIGMLVPIVFIAVPLYTIVTWYFMYRAAAAEVDSGYALRHLLLAVLLTPFLLIGVLLVPLMVESDLTKWRAVRAQQLAA